MCLIQGTDYQHHPPAGNQAHMQTLRADQLSLLLHFHSGGLGRVWEGCTPEHNSNIQNSPHSLLCNNSSSYILQNSHLIFVSR